VTRADGRRHFRTGTRIAPIRFDVMGVATESTMPDQSNRGRAQDRAKVAGGQKHETAYEAKKSGSTAGEVRTAVKNVGNSRAKVEAELKK
jgi:hypothetical protein